MLIKHRPFIHEHDPCRYFPTVSSWSPVTVAITGSGSLKGLVKNAHQWLHLCQLWVEVHTLGSAWWVAVITFDGLAYRNHKTFIPCLLGQCKLLTDANCASTKSQQRTEINKKSFYGKIVARLFEMDLPLPFASAKKKVFRLQMLQKVFIAPNWDVDTNPGKHPTRHEIYENYETFSSFLCFVRDSIPSESSWAECMRKLKASQKP